MVPQAVFDAGATVLDGLSGENPSLLAEVKLQYNDAIIWTFRIVLITTCLSALGVIFVEWRIVRGGKVEMVDHQSIFGMCRRIPPLRCLPLRYL